VNFISFLLWKIFIKFEILNFLLASFTNNIFILRFPINRFFSETIYVTLMEAVSTLQHCHLHVFLINLCNCFITVFAKLFFVFKLQIFVIGLSSFSFIFTHEIINVISVCLLISHKFISWVDLHVFIFFVLFFWELLLWFLLTDLTDLATIILRLFFLLFGLTFSLGYKRVKDGFHVINFELVWILH